MTKLALFLCGNLAGRALEHNGSYLDIYTDYLQATSPAHPFTLDPFLVTEQQFPSADQEDTYHAIILTGSAANAYDDLPWITALVAYIARIASDKPHIRLIGICFGHQIIARALGGQCVPNSGRWEVGPTPIALTQLGKSIFGPRDTLTIQQMHRDHVPSVPPNADLHLLASSELSPNQGMVKFYPTGETHVHGKSHIQILTIQGHPEFTQPIISDIVEQRSAAGVMPKEVSEDLQVRLEKGWDKLAQKDSTDTVGKVIWDIIGGKI